MPLLREVGSSPGSHTPRTTAFNNTFSSVLIVNREHSLIKPGAEVPQHRMPNHVVPSMTRRAHRQTSLIDSVIIRAPTNDDMSSSLYLGLGSRKGRSPRSFSTFVSRLKKVAQKGTGTYLDRKQISQISQSFNPIVYNSEGSTGEEFTPTTYPRERQPTPAPSSKLPTRPGARSSEICEALSGNPFVDLHLVADQHPANVDHYVRVFSPDMHLLPAALATEHHPLIMQVTSVDLRYLSPLSASKQGRGKANSVRVLTTNTLIRETDRKRGLIQTREVMIKPQPEAATQKPANGSRTKFEALLALHDNLTTISDKSTSHNPTAGLVHEMPAPQQHQSPGSDLNMIIHELPAPEQHGKLASDRNMTRDADAAAVMAVEAPYLSVGIPTHLSITLTPPAKPTETSSIHDNVTAAVSDAAKPEVAELPTAAMSSRTAPTFQIKDTSCDAEEFDDQTIPIPHMPFGTGSARITAVPAVYRQRISTADLQAPDLDVMTPLILQLDKWEWCSVPILDLWDPRESSLICALVAH